MKSTSMKWAAAALSLVTMCGLGGCILVNPINGTTIHNGNDRVHFGGYGPSGEKYYAEAYNWSTNRWERLQGEFSGTSGAVANGVLAAFTGESPTVTLNDGSLWYDWRDRFFVTPAQWTGRSGNWYARVRATDADGKLLCLRGSDGNGDPSLPYIWIRCTDSSLRTWQREWWLP